MLFSVATPIIVTFLKLAWLTFRFRLQEDEKFTEIAERGEPVVLAFWHEGILTAGWYVAKLLKRGVRMTILISPSADGELERYPREFRQPRGERLRAAKRCRRAEGPQPRHRRGPPPAIAVDGSKGPRRYCKPGAIMVARIAGVPIVPVGFAASRGWRAPRDRHLVPYPGSRVAITIGEPFLVEKKIDADTLEERRRELEERLNQLMEISEARVGVQSEATRAFAGRKEEDV